MHLLTLALLVTTATAAVIQRQNDPHVLDFRTWGSKDCGQDNQGIWTFTESDVTGECKHFADYGVVVNSLSLVSLTQPSNHTLQVFWSDDCDSADYHFPTPDRSCFAPPEGSLKAFRIN
ncbi:hypothetical protein GE09DRAFT_1276639 [Coniochaeta sp. 2T2.1]|nr:hypothetical protein GE09DRAFT_1276639 [Coniochaeta sp. 2T2.1]